MGFLAKAKIDGLDQVFARLAGMKRRVKNTILRKAMRRSAALVLKAAKTNLVAKDTGLLRKSLGSNVKAYRSNGVVVAIIGPRKGFRQQVTRKDGASVMADPVKYAHLVEKGRVEVVSEKSVLSDGTVVFGRRVKAVPPRPFLGPALEKNRDAIRKVVADTVTEELAKLGGD